MAVLSAQGERQAEVDEGLYADQAFVDDLARNASDGVATCRARGRHNYPPMSRIRMGFTGRDDGLLERRSDWCTDCGCVRQVQVWEPYETTVGRRKSRRVRPLFNYPEYDENERGETYLTKGHGRVSARAFSDALASQTLLVDQESYDLVLTALRQQRKNNKENQ